jgi:hypothetical protein
MAIFCKVCELDMLSNQARLIGKDYYCEDCAIKFIEDSQYRGSDCAVCLQPTCEGCEMPDNVFCSECLYCHEFFCAEGNISNKRICPECSRKKEIDDYEYVSCDGCPGIIFRYSISRVGDLNLCKYCHDLFFIKSYGVINP